jgi:hypothetical protein
MLDERVHAPERDGVGEQTYAGRHGGRGVVAAAKTHGDHRAGAAQLATEKTPRIAVAPRIEDLRDRGVLREPGGDAPGALLLALHPQRECGKPTVQQVGPERVEESARDGPHAPQRLDRPFGPGDDAGDHVTVSAEVLRRAVQCHRRAQIDRVLQHGRRERVVHDDGDFSACATTAAMSTSSRVGLAGVSSTTSPVSWRMLAATSSS